jgi:hypothetical protein
MLTYADVCWRINRLVQKLKSMLDLALIDLQSYKKVTYADVCWRMTYADVCWRRHAYLALIDLQSYNMVGDLARSWASADVRWRMLTYDLSSFCWRMPTYEIAQSRAHANRLPTLQKGDVQRAPFPATPPARSNMHILYIIYTKHMLIYMYLLHIYTKCMLIHMYCIYIYVCVYIHTRVYVHIYICTYVCVCVSVCVCVYIYIVEGNTYILNIF